MLLGLILGLVSLCGAASAVAAEEGRAFSEDFEQGRQAWGPAEIGVLDVGCGGAEGASLKLADADNAAYSTTSCAVSVQPESRYEVRFRCYSQDAAHASLCILQREKDGREATVDGKRLVHWYWPFRDASRLGRWIEANHTFDTGPTTARVSIVLNPADGSREHAGTAWFDDIAIVRTGRAIRPAEKSLPLTPLTPLSLDFGAAGCTIVCPQSEPLWTAAQQLAAAVATATQRAPRVVPDTADPTTLEGGPLLVMGNLMVSALGKLLYFSGYDFTDYAWPGKGGYVVRAVRDPFGTGAHVLMIGGSYPDDIVRAAERVAELLDERGPRPGYVNEVKLGSNAAEIRAWSEEFLQDDADWRRVGSLGSWEYLWRIGRAGMGYLRTGEEAYLEPFRRELLYFFEHDVLDRKQEAPSQIHSLVDAVLVPWDLFADHPFFTAAERREIDEKFLQLACSHEGPRPMKGAGWGLRGNHGLGRALDGLWLGRYFWRRYGIDEARVWLDLVSAYFAPQLQSSKPGEDGGYHQFSASLLCTLMYALATGNQEYLTGRALREATDRAVMEYRIGKGPMAYLGARAAASGDAGYLALMAHVGDGEYVRNCASMRYGNLLGENLRSFCAFETPQEKPELLGANVAPLDPMWHERMTRSTNDGDFMLTTRPEQSYDKLVIRDSYRPETFYLKIDGLGCGGHSFQDANCITAYREGGVTWLFEQYGYRGPTCSTLRQQNGVFVALDGQGPPAVHVCARLLYTHKLADGIDSVGGALEGIGDVAWHRHLVRKKGAWTLVIDRAIATKQGELLAERYWHMRPWHKPGEVTVTDGVAVSRSGDLAFHLQSVGLPIVSMTGTSSRKEVVRAEVPAHGYAEFASLLWVDDQPDAARYRLEQTEGGWRVHGGDGVSTFGIAASGDGVRLLTGPGPASRAPALDQLPVAPAVADVSLPWRRLDVGDEVTAVAASAGRIAAGTRGGLVKVMTEDGATQWESKVDSWVLSLHFVADDLLVGEDDGTIARFDAAGKRLWCVTIPYAHIGWPHWSDQRSRIREITSADIDGNGDHEVLLSNGDRRLYAFTGSGTQLWKKGVQWGVLIGLTPATFGGEFVLFGGVTGPTLGGRVKLHNGEGKTVGRLQIPHQHSQQIRDIRLADLTGDGSREVIVARDSSSNQLVVCGEDLALLWKADVGGSPDALAVREHDGAVQILCGSRCGYLHAFDGATGEHLWFCYLGEEPRMLWVRADGSVLSFCLSGSVFVTGADGRLTGRQQLSAPITALLRPGEHRAQAARVPVGVRDGGLFVLAE